jgi:hypothetical protein
MHSKLSQLLLQVHLSRVRVDDAEAELLPDMQETWLSDTTLWSLKTIFFALSDEAAFKEIVYQVVSGSLAVCFEAPSRSECAEVVSSFGRLLPKAPDFALKSNDSGVWHACGGGGDCQASFRVSLVPGSRFEVSGQASQDSAASKLVREVVRVVGRSGVEWIVGQIRLAALSEGWTSEARCRFSESVAALIIQHKTGSGMRGSML